jgi:hypothetical protein
VARAAAATAAAAGAAEATAVEGWGTTEAAGHLAAAAAAAAATVAVAVGGGPGRSRWGAWRCKATVALVDKLSTEKEVALTAAILVAVVVPSNCVESGVRELVASRRSKRIVECGDPGFPVVLGK